jgi:cob(I)alamin adenosyltransferase
MLNNPAFDLVILDEMTYMLSFDYLNHDEVLTTISQRPKEQSVVVTGRGGGKALQAIMDTVSEVKEIKHAYTAGIKARHGVDY